METLVLLALCCGNLSVIKGFPSQRVGIGDIWLWVCRGFERLCRSCAVHVLHTHLMPCNRPISQIPQCTCSIHNNAPFRTEMSTLLFWMVHCGIWNKCIVEFVNDANCWRLTSILQQSLIRNIMRFVMNKMADILPWAIQMHSNAFCWQKYLSFASKFTLFCH